MRPSALRCAGSKLWTPIDSRLTPAARKSANFCASKVPGLASSVISASGASGSLARIADSSSSSARADSREGVPPPKKTVYIGLPQTCGSASSRSAISDATYSRSGISPFVSWELKSQYGHLRTHHGIWTYSDRGGSAASVTIPAGLVNCWICMRATSRDESEFYYNLSAIQVSFAGQRTDESPPGRL